MAHFAELNSNNIVVRVVVAPDDGGEEWCQEMLGGAWKRTSYIGAIRWNFAGIGYTYDAVKDAFIPLSPYPSWALDELIFQWRPPQPFPNDGKLYYWSEQDRVWVEYQIANVSLGYRNLST